MKSQNILFLLSFLLLCPPVLGQDVNPVPPAVERSQDGPQFKMQTKIYQIKTHISGDTSLTEHIFPDTNGQEFSAIRGRATYFTLAELQIGEFKLIATEDKWKWEPKEPNSVSMGIRLLAKPQVLAESDMVCKIISGEEIPYAERKDNGLYEIKTISKRTGLEFEFQMKPVEDRIDFKVNSLSYTAVVGREPTEGTTLNIGFPELETVEHKDHLLLVPGKLYGMMMRTEKSGILLIQIKVEFVEMDETDAE